MTRINSLHAKWVNDPAYRVAYEALDGEFALAGAPIQTRTQAVIARIESGSNKRSTHTQDN